jgi:hypothetical protein
LSPFLCISIFRERTLLAVFTAIFCENPSDSDVVPWIFHCLIQVIDTVSDSIPDAPGEEVQPFFALFLAGDCPCLVGLSICLFGWPDLADQLITTPVFPAVADALSRSAGRPLAEAMVFVQTILTRCAAGIRAALLAVFEDFPREWLAVGQREDPKIVAQWATQTEAILNHNWARLRDPFAEVGILGHLLFCATEACFKIRAKALLPFLACAERLPTRMLKEMVRGGLIANFAEISREIDGEQSVRILDFLRFLLTAGLDASFIQEVHADILESSLVPSVELMMESLNEQVREAAAQFHNEFLDVSRYLEDF